MSCITERRRTRIATWIAIACVTSVAPATAQIYVSDDLLPTLTRDQPLDAAEPLNTIRSVDPLSLQRRFAADAISARFVRVHFVVEQGQLTGGRQLVVLDAGGSTRDVLDQARFNAAGAWTLAVPGNAVVVQLEGGLPGDEIRIRADLLRYQSTQPAQQAVLGPQPNFVDLVSHFGTESDYFRFGATITYISFMTKDTHRDTNCTGFLLAESLVVTNEHCISDPSQLATAFVQFDYEGTTPLGVHTVRLAGIAATNGDLDYTVLRLATPQQIPPVRLATADAKRQQQMALIQHPNGAPKMIDVTLCDVTNPRTIGKKDDLASDIAHRCDSEGGSSGAPLMDRSSGTVFGLHHIAKHDPKSDKTYNYAVSIVDIMADLCRHKRPVYFEILGTGDHGQRCPGEAQ